MKKKRKICLLLLLFLLVGTIHTSTVMVYADEDNGFTENELIKEKAEEYKDKNTKIDPVSALIIWVLLATAFLKIAQQMDSILRSLGIGTPVGNGRGGAFNTAMQVIRTGESVSKMYRANAKTLADFGGGLKGNDTYSNNGMHGNDSNLNPGFQNGGASDITKEFASNLFQANDGGESTPVTGKAAEDLMSHMFGDKFSERVVTDQGKIDELAAQHGMEGKESGMWVDMGKGENGEQQYANISNLSWGNGISGEFNGKPFQALNEAQFGELSPEEQNDYARYSMSDGSDLYMKQDTGAMQEEGILQPEESTQAVESPTFINQEEGIVMNTEQGTDYENVPSFHANMEGNGIQENAPSFQTEQDVSNQTMMNQSGNENLSAFYYEESGERGQLETENSFDQSEQELSFQTEEQSSMNDGVGYHSFGEQQIQDTSRAPIEGSQFGQENAFHQTVESANETQTGNSFTTNEAQENYFSQGTIHTNKEGENIQFHSATDMGTQNDTFHQDTTKSSNSFEPASSHPVNENKLDLDFKPDSQSAGFTQDFGDREV